MAINFKDSRFQDAMLRANANPLVNKIGAQEQVTAGFTGQQQGMLNAFRGLETQKRDFQSSMGLQRGRLNLSKKRLSFQKKSFKQNLHDKRQELTQSTLLGFGTAGLSFLEGRRRAQKTATLTKQKSELVEIMKKYYGSKT